MTRTGGRLQLCCIAVKPNPSFEKRKFANGLTLISQNGNCLTKPSLALYYTKGPKGNNSVACIRSL